MRASSVFFGTIGLLATVLAGLVVFDVPIAAAIIEIAQTVDVTLVLVLGGLLLGIAGLLAAWITGPDSASGTTFDAAVDNPPESVTAPEGSLVGAGIDASFDDAVAGDEAELSSLVDRLRATAAETYALATDSDLQAARQAITAGTWTDDDVATALLAPDTPQPLLARLRLWLDAESERERRIRRTIDEIRRLGGEH